MLKHSILLAGLLLVSTAPAQDTDYPANTQLIPGPARPADFQTWLKDISHWRDERRIRLGHDGSEYNRPELAWTRDNFIQTVMMVEDRYFYDPAARRYTVDRYLDDLALRYGGIDSVVIWPVYPNLGIDSRNQYDLLRDLPGGITAIRLMVRDFQRRGVRVFFPVNPWDRGTREAGPMDATTVELCATLGADGIFGDTFDALPRTFRSLSDLAGRPLALEPEGETQGAELSWNNLSWARWKYTPGYGVVPGVSVAKWLEPRHMVHVGNSWGRDCTDDLQYVFFNGVGFNSWENVWGIRNHIPARDAEALRRISKIERIFARLLASPAWEPHTPVLQENVFASKWPGSDATLWTIVNRNPYDLAGRQIELPAKEGLRYFDVWHGVELKPEAAGRSIALSFELEAFGFGAILATAAPDPQVAKLLAEMNALSVRRLQDFSNAWHPLPQAIADVSATSPADTAPPGMTPIPSTQSFVFRVSGIEIEGANAEGVDVQYPWENSPRRHHLHSMAIPAFYIDTFPVTNAEFARFLDATNYRPVDSHNFLRDWKDGKYPSGWDSRPVTWVSLEDARAYARWAGKRLPHEWEWQYAAQGSDGRNYPWGNEWRESAVPKPDRGRDMRGPDPVTAHPEGASIFGVQDLTGNVWQWTDEFIDEHTRAAVLRGGSYYQPQGSHWYFPQAYKLTEHGKYLLMAPGKDRSGAVGFRCAKDRR